MRYSEEYQLKGNAKVYYCKGNDKGTKDTLARGLETMSTSICARKILFDNPTETILRMHLVELIRKKERK